MKRIAVVTGASSGLGREYVRLLDERLAAHPGEKLDEIWVIARRRDRLEALQGDVRIPLRVFPLDLTSPSFESEIRHLYEAEKPDIAFLINAAGFGKIGSYADISERDAGHMVDLNCKAPVLMCQLSIPYMQEGARILNVCSTAAFSAFQYFGIYCASKSFLYRYSRSLRVELLSRRISVTAVCPYWIKDTEFIPVAQEADTHSCIRHFVLASSRSTVARWSMADTMNRFAVSTPGPVCTLHRIFGKIIPNELMAGIWALLRRI